MNVGVPSDAPRDERHEKYSVRSQALELSDPDGVGSPLRAFQERAKFAPKFTQSRFPLGEQ
jgi:hypothetical protein